MQVTYAKNLQNRNLGKMISVSDETQDSSFKVSDRRRFSSEGAPLDETQEAPQPSEETTRKSGETEADASAKPPASEPEPPPPSSQPLPPASFEMLVVSLGIQAQFELGGEGTPENRPPDLNVARHSIDMLGVLKDKTQGNLSLEESRLLDNTLTELRFRYIQRVEEINKKAKA